MTEFRQRPTKNVYGRSIKRNAGRRQQNGLGSRGKAPKRGSFTKVRYVPSRTQSRSRHSKIGPSYRKLNTLQSASTDEMRGARETCPDQDKRRRKSGTPGAASSERLRGVAIALRIP